MSDGLPFYLSTLAADPINGRIRFTSTGRDRQGEIAIKIARTIDFGNSNLRGGETFLATSLRGRRLGRQVIRNSFRLSEFLGLARMSIHAVLDGRYAWARCGFAPDPEAWPRIKKQLLSVLDAERFRKVPTERHWALQVIASDSPRALHMLSKIDTLVEFEDAGEDERVPFGRALLCSLTMWHGTFDMASEMSRMILFGDTQ
ncbi:hypothetical protein [Mesorhizobium sp. M0011]|uniref:hypothetical protein n=1 Tax=Mesorhizobium sp. M0011 TaxID=2956839 RepID=UPI00333CEB9B